MKRFFLAGIFASLILTFFSATQTQAIDLGIGRAKDAAVKAGFSGTTSATTLSETLGTVVKGALSLVGVIFMILILYAGFLWMTASGKEDQITKAQDIIRTAIIGLIITLGAYSITAFVVPRITARTTGPAGGDASVGSTPLNLGCCVTCTGGTCTKVFGLTDGQCRSACQTGYTCNLDTVTTEVDCH